MSKSRAKGTMAESAVVRFLRENGYPHAERRALSGINDKGDIAGIVGVVVEVKNHAKYKIPEWLREVEVEVANAKADHGFLIVKPNGVGEKRVGEWWAVLPLEGIVRLLREAGYGDPL